MIVLGVLGAGVAAAGLWVVERVWRRPPHLRANYRGEQVVGAAGVALAPVLACLWPVTLAADSGRPTALAMAACGIAMAVLGYVDDMYGDRRAGGLIGHARALLRGRVTTGTLKAVGGAVVGVGAAAIVGWRGPWLVAAGAVVALASNLANLFDLRPGRTIKVWVPLAVWAGVAVGAEAPRVLLGGLAGGVFVFLAAELRERVMLGDTGAGLLGGVLGVVAVATLGRTGIVVAVSALLALTLLSEVVSFSRVIDAVPPLRWADRLGRRRDGV